jgi:tropinone reductase I
VIFAYVQVNNARQSLFKAAAEVSSEDYGRIISRCSTQLAHPLLLSGTVGGVVHVSSTAGLIGFPAISVYSMTKGAMNQLTRSLTTEWAPDGIRVNCVARGGIKTHNDGDVRLSIS